MTKHWWYYTDSCIGRRPWASRAPTLLLYSQASTACPSNSHPLSSPARWTKTQELGLQRVVHSSQELQNVELAGEIHRGLIAVEETLTAVQSPVFWDAQKRLQHDEYVGHPLDGGEGELLEEHFADQVAEHFVVVAELRDDPWSVLYIAILAQKCGIKSIGVHALAVPLALRKL